MTDFRNLKNLHKFDFNKLFTFSDIQPSTQNHLAKVYGTFATGLFASILAGVLGGHDLFPIEFNVVLCVACLVLEVYLWFSDHDKNFKLKALTFYGFASCIGALLGYFYLGAEVGEDKKAVLALYLTCFIYTAQIFIVFSVFALLTVRRAAIFSYSCIACFILSLIDCFVFDIELGAIVGLLIGILYIVIDTQIIIYKAENGIFDFFTDAKHLYLDFLKVFIEVISLVGGKSSKKNDE